MGWSLCRAQTSNASQRNALSVELGKTGLIYHLNVDHQLAGKKVGFRLGAGSNFAHYLNAIVAGAGSYYLAGTQNCFLELGADLQYVIVDEVSEDQKSFSLLYPDFSIKTFSPSLNAGYRSYGKRTLFRIGLSPGIMKSGFVPGGYVSYGFRF